MSLHIGFSLLICFLLFAPILFHRMRSFYTPFITMDEPYTSIALITSFLALIFYLVALLFQDSIANLDTGDLNYADKLKFKEEGIQRWHVASNVCVIISVVLVVIAIVRKE